VPNQNQKKDPPPSSGWVPVGPVEPAAPALSTEWMAQRFFSDWTADELLLAIRKDIDIDLAPFADYIADRMGEALRSWFSSDLGRPDLGAVFATEEGKAWLKKKIQL